MITIRGKTITLQPLSLFDTSQVVDSLLALKACKLCAVIDQKLSESGIDPDRLPPQTPEEHAEACREVMQLLRAHIID